MTEDDEQPARASQRSRSPRESMDNSAVEMDPTNRYMRFKEELLGSGSFKSVFRAFDREEGIEVAWNQFRVGSLGEKESTRLQLEIEILRKLNHAHVIRLLDSWVDTDLGNAVFITEIMASGTLKDYVHQAKSLKRKTVKKWCSQILVGLKYLHEQDPPIIHRDLKCENIFIDGHEGIVKIGDLGLSTMLHRSRREAQSVVGTPEFMAPEVFDENYTERADIYAFGMSVIEMVTGEYPYSECLNYAQVYRRVTTNKKPRAFYWIVDKDVRAFIERCLLPASERPSAAQLLDDPFLSIQPMDDVETVVDRSSDGSSDLESVPRGSLSELEKPDEDISAHASIHLDPVEVTSVTDLTEDNIQFCLKVRPTPTNVQNVTFEFSRSKDTAETVAFEMARDLNLPDSMRTEIAESIQQYIDSKKIGGVEPKKGGTVVYNQPPATGTTVTSPVQSGVVASPPQVPKEHPVPSPIQSPPARTTTVDAETVMTPHPMSLPLIELTPQTPQSPQLVQLTPIKPVEPFVTVPVHVADTPHPVASTIADVMASLSLPASVVADTPRAKDEISTLIDRVASSAPGITPAPMLSSVADQKALLAQIASTYSSSDIGTRTQPSLELGAGITTNPLSHQPTPFSSAPASMGQLLTSSVTTEAPFHPSAPITDVVVSSDIQSITSPSKVTDRITPVQAPLSDAGSTLSRPLSATSLPVPIAGDADASSDHRSSDQRSDIRSEHSSQVLNHSRSQSPMSSSTGYTSGSAYSRTICPFFLYNGQCHYGDKCYMAHQHMPLTDLSDFEISDAVVDSVDSSRRESGEVPSLTAASRKKLPTRPALLLEDDSTEGSEEVLRQQYDQFTQALKDYKDRCLQRIEARCQAELHTVEILYQARLKKLHRLDIERITMQQRSNSGLSKADSNTSLPSLSRQASESRLTSFGTAPPVSAVASLSQPAPQRLPNALSSVKPPHTHHKTNTVTRVGSPVTKGSGSTTPAPQPAAVHSESVNLDDLLKKEFMKFEIEVSGKEDSSPAPVIAKEPTPTLAEMRTAKATPLVRSSTGPTQLTSTSAMSMQPTASMSSMMGGSVSSMGSMSTSSQYGTPLVPMAGGLMLPSQVPPPVTKSPFTETFQDS